MKVRRPTPKWHVAGDAGELSTGTGALLVLLVMFLLVEEGHRRLR